MQYFKNLNEFVLYASISCGLAFLTRLFPQIFFATLVLRLFLIVAAYYMLHLDNMREVALLIILAIVGGWIIGYLDLLELYWHFDPSTLIGWCLAAVALFGGSILVWSSFYVRNKPTR